MHLHAVHGSMELEPFTLHLAKTGLQRAHDWIISVLAK